MIAPLQRKEHGIVGGRDVLLAHDGCRVKQLHRIAAQSGHNNHAFAAETSPHGDQCHALEYRNERANGYCSDPTEQPTFTRLPVRTMNEGNV